MLGPKRLRVGQRGGDEAGGGQARAPGDGATQLLAVAVVGVLDGALEEAPVEGVPAVEEVRDGHRHGAPEHGEGDRGRLDGDHPVVLGAVPAVLVAAQDQAAGHLEHVVLAGARAVADAAGQTQGDDLAARRRRGAGQHAAGAGGDGRGLAAGAAGSGEGHRTSSES